MIPLLDIEEYREVDRYSTGFVNGTKPDWMHENVIGDGSVTYETDEGGRARLSTGTTSKGDGVRLEFGSSSGAAPITPSEYSAVVMTATTKGSADGTLVDHESRWLADGSNKIHLLRQFGNWQDGTNMLTIPDKDHENDRVTVVLVWDVERSRAYTVLGGQVSVLSDPMPAEPTLPYPVEILRWQTEDTAADREAYLYDASMTFYSR